MRGLTDKERKALDWVRRGDFAECDSVVLTSEDEDDSVVLNLYGRELVRAATAPDHLTDRFDIVHVLTSRGELARRVDEAARKAGVWP